RVRRMVRDVRLQDFALDGSANGSGPECGGVGVYQAAATKVRGLTANAIRGAAIGAWEGYANTFSDITTVSSGYLSSADVYLWIQAGCLVPSLQSTDADKAPELVNSHACHVSDVLARGARGGGIHLSNSSFVTETGIQVSASPVANGITIFGTSHHNRI